MNYTIITDEIALREFIDWLPVLQPHEKYYLCLFCRSKYTRREDGTNPLTHIKSDKAQLKRFTSDKERMFEKIKQLEVEFGAYTQKSTPVPQESLALYITVNPRDMYKATVNTMVKLAHSIRDQNVMMNPHQEALSEIQKAKSKTYYVDVDFDDKDYPLEAIERMTTYATLNRNSFTILETRGGYHILVDPSKVGENARKTWYQQIKSWKEVDQMGDCMIPVPGCTQGGFTPKLHL